MTVLFTLKVSEKDEQRLTEDYPMLEFIFCSNMDEAEKYIEQAEVIVTYGNDLDNTLIERATRLKWVSVLSAGLDDLPFQALEKKGVIVTNVRGIHKVPMAEYAISMLLQVYRYEKTLMKMQQQQGWGRSSVKPLEISGKTMLIAGTGAIGQEVARLAKAFNMKTIGVSRSGQVKDYFDVNVKTPDMVSRLYEADFIVSVLPSTQETKYLFKMEHFKAMKDEAVFLNMGRGDVVKSDVILEALQSKEIMHAVLDVFEEEPLPKEHPLWQADNITITPHLSGISPQYLPRALEIFEKNLNVYTEKGNAYINKIDMARGY